MRVPYKYPYISIFVLGYYFLEHEGYYYRIRNFFKGEENTKMNYIIQLDSQNYAGLAGGPGRKAFIYYTKENSENDKAYEKIARRCKEKLRSPWIFTRVNCESSKELCERINLPCLKVVLDGREENFFGSLDEKKIKKVVKKFHNV